MMNKKFEINVEGTKLMLEDKSHAGIFRQFWAHFINENVEKTIETIKTVGIRTSDQPNFVAKNGQKKKNILIQDDFYVYGHLTPAAMLKTYEKFQLGWDGKWVAEPKETSPEPTADVPTDEPQKTELEQANEEYDKELEAVREMESKQPEAQPEKPVKKLSPKEERKLKTAAILEKQRLEKEEKKKRAEERKKAKELAKQVEQELQESQEEQMELPNM